MKEKIKHEIDYLEFEIEEIQKRLDKDVDEFKAWISRCAAHDIAIIPYESKFKSIQSDVITISKLDDKKRWLMHLINE